MKIIATLVALVVGLTALAQRPTFDNIYSYIENTDVFELNQIEGHTVCVPHTTIDGASKADRWQNRNVLSLNGTWKFNFANTPEETPKDFFVSSFNDKAWSNISVPSNWEMQGFGDPMFRNVSQPFHTNPPFVPREYNPTGAYRKTFELPSTWKGQKVFLRMEKTASASFVWINGQEVGYNEGAQEPAEYDVTRFLKPGKNILVVKVLKYSNGVYLEDQDYWRLAGIFDDVWLYTTPDVHLFDWYATTDLDENYTNAQLNLQLVVKNYTKTVKSNYTVKASLFNASNQLVQSFYSEKIQLEAENQQQIKLFAEVKNPLKWTSETPNLYLLTMEMINAEGKTEEVIAGRIGFKETEIRHQVFYLNGKPIKLNAINSHMQHPDLGHAMNEETIRKDFEILKQFNINCVRTSHYPPVSRYLELADEYGLYIIDETGDECHATEYLSYNPAWEQMYRERVRKMVLRDRNHPSILFWSAGNESGEGDNICKVIDEGRKYDTTRYWMYGGNAFSHHCEEIIGPRYPTPFELKTQVGMVPESVDPRPSFMDEYLSVAGNAGGGLDEYWEVINTYPRVMGGAIWDFVSPGLREPIRKLNDSSPNQILAHVMGHGKLVAGQEGNGIDLNGHDQWIEVYQDENLEITGNELTLSLRIFPRALMSKGGTLLTKGNFQYGLQQVGADSIDFYVYTSKKETVRAALPKNWEQNWHHISAVYNGKTIAITIDDITLAEKTVTGNMKNFPFPLNVGRNSETQGQETSVYLCDAVIDQVAVFPKAINVDELKAASPELKSKAAMWLDFEQEEKQGEFFSYGIGARTYGSIWPNRVPEPEMWQIKKSAQPISVKWSDPDKFEIEVKNRMFFSNTNTLDAFWRLEENGIPIDSGNFDTDVDPQMSQKIVLSINKPYVGLKATYMVTISFRLKHDTQWAKKGFEIAWDQLELDWPHSVASIFISGDSLSVNESDLILTIIGKDFSYSFDKKSGSLISINFKEKEILKRGPKLNIWRAPLANELDDWTTYSVNVFPKTEGFGNWISTSWYALGLDKIRYELEHFSFIKAGKVIIVKVKEIAFFGNAENDGFENELIYTLCPEGEIELQHTINPQGKMPVWLPRLGTEWLLDQKLKQVNWLGRGPQENYPDRKTGYRIGQFRSTVEDMFVPYLLPEDNGLRTDNSWVKMVGDDGIGLEFSASQPFNFNCYNYTTENLSKAKYNYQLVKSDAITFNFDYQTTGVGCTARSVFNRYQTIPQYTRFISKIKLISPDKQ
jgi:beta-galactosidase